MTTAMKLLTAVVSLLMKWKSLSSYHTKRTGSLYFLFGSAPLRRRFRSGNTPNVSYQRSEYIRCLPRIASKC